MHTVSRVVPSGRLKSRPPRACKGRLSRARNLAHPRDNRPDKGTYRLVVSTSLDVRRAKFAAFIRAALEGARIQRGWTVAQLLEATNVGKTTFYRWMNGNWTEDPEAAKVRDFCDGLDIPAEQAFKILWPGKLERAAAPEPAPMDPDVLALLRKLADPSTNEQTKQFIRNAIRSLTELAEQKPTPPPRKRRAG
jgi:transcriptional regulator with XRE-family HTH domain